MNATNNVTSDLDPFDTWCDSFLANKGVNFFHRPVANYTMIGIGCVITVTAFVNNVVVFLALTLKRSRPSTQNVSLVLTSSLVYADLLLSVTTMPVTVYNMVRNVPSLGKIGCRIFNSADILLCNVSILHLMGLAFDRYLAICHPFTHHKLGTRSARMASVALWILSGLVVLPIFVPQWQKLYVTDDPAWRCLLRFSQSDHVCFFLASPVLHGLSIVLCFFLPLFIIIVLHVLIYLAARKHARSVQMRKLCHSGSDLSAIEASSNETRLKPASSRFGTTKLHSEETLRSVAYARGRSPKSRDSDDSHGVFLVNWRAQKEAEDLSQNGQRKEADSSVQSSSHLPVRLSTSQIHLIESGHGGNNKQSDGAAEDEGTSDFSRKQNDGHLPLRVSTSLTSFQENGGRRNGKDSKNKLHNSDRKAIRAVICLVLCFVVCWLPFFVSLMTDNFGGYGVPFYVLIFFNVLGFLNSAINPVLYYCFNVTVRGAMRKFLGLKTSDRDNRPMRLINRDASF